MSKTLTDSDLVQILRDQGVDVDDFVETVVETVTPAGAKAAQNEADTLAADNGLTPVRGRVYLSGDAIEAAARVANTGTGEVVEVTGGRTSHLILWRTELGTVAVQNAITA